MKKKDKYFQESKTAGKFSRPGTYNVTFGCTNRNSEKSISVPLSPLIAYDVIISQNTDDTLKYLFVSMSFKYEVQNAVVDFLISASKLSSFLKNET